MKLCFWWLNYSIFFGCLLSGLVINVSTISASTHSEEPAAEPAAEESAEAVKEEPDPFAVPEDATADELLQFIQKIQDIRRNPPKDRTPKGFQEHIRKIVTASIQAADKILSGEATDDQTVEAVEHKLEMLGMAVNLRMPEAEKNRKDYMESLQNDTRPILATVLKRFQLMDQILQWRTMEENKKQVFVDDLTAFLENIDLGRKDVQLVSRIGRVMEQSEDYEAAIKMYTSIVPIFQKSKDTWIAEFSKQLEGTARRLGLPGNEMPIEGILLNGDAFDWSAYKGKVILVDFWATWCGPCIREMPNVKEAYQNYHAKGFEIVGISLDEDIEKVKKYVETNEIPWAILFSDVEEATGWKHPMAVHYGIQAIPATILVGQDGKVVSLSARGTALGDQLKELLGDPSPPEEEKEEAAPSADTTDDPKEKNEGDSD